MTTIQKLDALDRLIAAVKAGEFDGQPFKYNAFAKAWEAAFGAYTEPNFTGPEAAYHGSLDAALALHNALFPGWGWLLSASNAKVSPYNDTEDVAGSYGMADNPARAWLLAILKAYRAQVTQ